MLTVSSARPVLISQVIAGNVASNPAFFQTKAGTPGAGTHPDFALLVPDRNGGLLSYTRANDVAGVPWHGPIRVFDDFGALDAITAIASGAPNSGVTPGELRVVGRQGSQLVFAWRDDDAVTPWHGLYPIAAGANVSGTPSLIQSSALGHESFEIVTPRASGGLAHLWRESDHGAPWNGPVAFGGATAYTGVSLVQSSDGSSSSAGNLALAAVSTSGALDFYTRGSSPGAAWSAPATIGAGAVGMPALVQSKDGAGANAKRLYEVFVPAADTGVDEYRRECDVENGQAWTHAGRILTSLGHVDSIAVFEGSPGAPGSLELVARVNRSLRVHATANEAEQAETPDYASIRFLVVDTRSTPLPPLRPRSRTGIPNTSRPAHRRAGEPRERGRHISDSVSGEAGESRRREPRILVRRFVDDAERPEQRRLSRLHDDDPRRPLPAAASSTSGSRAEGGSRPSIRPASPGSGWTCRWKGSPSGGSTITSSIEAGITSAPAHPPTAASARTGSDLLYSSSRYQVGAGPLSSPPRRRLRQLARCQRCRH